MSLALLWRGGAGGGSRFPGLMSRMGHQLLKLHDIPTKGGENDIPTEGGNQTVDSSIKCNGMEGRYYVAVDSRDMISLLCRFLIKIFFQIPLLREKGTLISFLYPAQNSALIDELAKRNNNVFAMDCVPRISRAQVV